MIESGWFSNKQIPCMIAINNFESSVRISGGVQSAISESKSHFRVEELSQVVYYATDGIKDDNRADVDPQIKYTLIFVFKVSQSS